LKVATIFGTRPEIIRLSRVIEAIDRVADQVLVHTGQNFDPNLSDVFFSELGVRTPDEYWGIRAGSMAAQMAEIIRLSGEFLLRARPDRVLILGDTNSGLAAMVAARMRIPVYHMEAGNRCYDDRVPEEINRRVIDHCSEVLLPYTQRSKENLIAEGIDRNRIYVSGNPIHEVIEASREKIAASAVLERFGLTSRGFFLVTLHRAENVDDPQRLAGLMAGLDLVSETFSQPIVVSLHPRTADRLKQGGISPKSPLVRFTDPLGFFDFVRLEAEARCILTDSGTVQEEAALLHTPNVIVRDVTERAETLEAGAGVLSGGEPHSILRSVGVALASPTDWTPPVEYTQANVSAVVANLVCGYHRAKTR